MGEVAGLLDGRDAEHCRERVKRRKASFPQKREGWGNSFSLCHLPRGMNLSVFLYKSVLSQLYPRATHQTCGLELGLL